MTAPRTVAALYVEADGPYSFLWVPSVDLWPERRDARLYAGPHPVVAHPPCNRWSTIAAVNQAKGLFRIGDDGGCFAAALSAVRRFGGVLEHPANTFAWRRHALKKPDRAGGWERSPGGGWVAHVEQGYYGCPARKPTWLYAVGTMLPALRWGPSAATARVSRLRRGKGFVQGRQLWQGSRAASATPEPFRDLLLQMARSVPA